MITIGNVVQCKITLPVEVVLLIIQLAVIEGRKVDAIREVRAYCQNQIGGINFQCGLKEAKDYVDSLVEQFKNAQAFKPWNG